MHYDHFAFQINCPSRNTENRLQRQNWTFSSKTRIQFEAKAIRKEILDLRESDMINLAEPGDRVHLLSKGGLSIIALRFLAWGPT